jgi:hypothetical protein
MVTELALESTGVACRLTQHNGQGLACSLIYDIQKVIGASRNLPQIYPDTIIVQNPSAKTWVKTLIKLNSLLFENMH